MTTPLRGLYAIADTGLIPEDSLVEWVGLAVQGGARLVQYRDKAGDPGLREWQATDLLHLCRGLQVPLIINDDVELAGKLGAAGVHLGQTDMPAAQVRRELGDAALIGVSCHSSLELALAAQAAGASYVAFGRFFPSHTKPIAVQADPILLRDAKRALKLPVAAIGGVTPHNASILIEAGADMLAVVHGLFGQRDIKAAAAQFSRLFV